MKAFSWCRPTDVRSALSVLSGTRRPKGGGIDLLDLAKRGISAPEVLVDLSGLAEGAEAFSALTAGPDGLVLGGRTTLARIAASPEVAAACPALADAAREAATPQIRVAATLAGNLLQRPRCAYFRDPWFAECRKRGGGSCPAREGVHDDLAVLGNGLCAATHPSNLATVLAACGATARILTGTDEKGALTFRAAPLDDTFYVKPEEDALREHRLKPGELLWDVTVPTSKASAYVEVNHKQSYDWAAAACAASLVVAGGRIASARLVLGALAPVPWSAAAAAESLRGAPVADGAALDAAARRAADVAASQATPLAENGYKVALLRVVVRRAVEAAAARVR